MTIPQTPFALIGGSANWGIAFPEDIAEPGVTVLARDLTFATPYGDSTDWKLLEFDGSITADGKPRQVLYVFSHGWGSEEIDHRSHQKAFWVLREAGVRRIIASSTSGSLNRAVMEGDLVIANDILELTQTRYSLLPGRLRYDASGKALVCPECSRLVEQIGRSLWPAGRRVYGQSAGLVCAHAAGPRLTSPAEVMAYRSMGADFLNHSFAPEVSLAREIGACISNISFVTAAFQGYFSAPEVSILGEGIYETLGPIASKLALRVMAALPQAASCRCASLHSAQPEAHYHRR